MPTILLLTVGGASAPVVSAIAAHQPAYVVFVTSQDQRDPPRPGSYITVDGPGEPCDVRPEQKCPSCKAVIAPRQSKPAIVAQAGLSSKQYEVVQVEPDDLNEAYAAIRSLLADLRQRFPAATMIGDYTGGTKTMSAALMLAALERGDCELALMVGQRSNLQRVDDGTEMAMAVDTRSWRVQRSLNAAAELFDRYDYAAAAGMLETMLREVGLTPGLRSVIQRRVQLCRGFDAWDRFEHAEAYRLLQPFAQALGGHFQALLLLNGKGKTSGYELVFDLLRNAERRAERGRYDDAVARLYRMTELLAQRRLELSHGQRTGDLDVTALPAHLNERYAQRRESGSGKVRLGLQDAYQLLAELDDPLGATFATLRGPLHNALTARNSSLLAHGMIPIDKTAYGDLHSQIEALIAAARQAGLSLGRPVAQFPSLAELSS